MSEPFYQDKWATLYLGDAMDYLPQVSEADLLVTDPPYGVSYQSNRRGEQFALIAGDDSTDVAETVLKATMPRIRKGRHVYVFGPFETLLASLPVAALTELVWDKGIVGMGDLALPWGKSHEQIWFGVYTPSRKARDDGYGKQAARMRKQTVLKVQRKQSRENKRVPTEKPVPLLRDLIESSSSSGETVFDPFAGSGSTLVAATLEGRKSIGVEIDPGYAEIAAGRLRNAAAIVRQQEGL